MQLQHVYTGKYLCVNSSHTSSTLESTNLRVTFLFSTVSLVKRLSVYWLCIASLYVCHWHCGIVNFHWYFADGTVKWEFAKLHFHGPPTIQSWFSRGWGKLQNVYRSLICCTNGVVCESFLYIRTRSKRTLASLNLILQFCWWRWAGSIRINFKDSAEVLKLLIVSILKLGMTKR